MASPTEAQVQSRLQATAKLSRTTYRNAGAATDNFVSLQETLRASAATDFDDQAEATVWSMRDLYSKLIQQSKNLMDPVLRAYGKICGFASKDGQTLVSGLYNWFVGLTPNSTGPWLVASREFVFGAVTNVSSPTGTGELLRLNVDAYGYAIESQWPQTVTARVIRDQNLGAEKHEEVWLLEPAPASRDALVITGSGQAQELRTYSARDSKISNGSFETSSNPPTATSGGGATTTPGSTTAVTDWILDTAANYRLRADKFWRGYPGLNEKTTDTTKLPTCLAFMANGTIYQYLSARQKNALSSSVPYLLQCKVLRESNGDGTLTLKIKTFGGSTLQTVSVDATTLTSDTTNANWATLRIAIGSGHWPKNFTANNLVVEISLASRTTGNVCVDEVLLVPWQPFANGWVMSLGGQTPWAFNDRKQWTDAAYGTPVIQEVLWRSYGLYWPSVPAKPSTGCAAADSGIAGNPNGAYLYKVTFVDAQGNESGGNTTGTAITVASKKVDLTSIPTGSAAISSRKVYRTVASGSTYKLLTTIADNVTTTYQDNTADGSLGATMPTGVNLTDPT